MSATVTDAPSASRRRDWVLLDDTHPAAIVLGVAILLWIVVFGVLVWRRHELYGTIDFDLGIHDQSIWQLSRGHWFTTVRGLPIFGHHATFGYFLLVPFYWLGAGPQFIDLLQVVVLALGAVPIYLLARDRLRSPWAALVPGLVWLLQPSVQWFTWETFHPEVIAIVAVLCAYLAAERNRIGAYWVFVFLAIIWKEDLALLFIGLGLLYLLRKRWRLGAATIAVGAIWFAAFAMVMVPHLAGGRTVYGPLYGKLGDSPGEVMKTAITDPGAVASRLKQNGSGSYAVELMAPMAFTPLAAPGLLLLGVPQAIVNLLSTANFTWDVRYHYAALPVVALALGMVEGIAVARSTLPETGRPALDGARRHARVRAVRHPRLGAVAGERALSRRLLADRGRARHRGQVACSRGDPEGRRRERGLQPRTPPRAPPAHLHVPEPVDLEQLRRRRHRASRPGRRAVARGEHVPARPPEPYVARLTGQQRPVRRRLVRPRRDGRPPREAAGLMPDRARDSHPIARLDC